MLVSFVCADKGAEAALEGLRRDYVVPGVVVKFQESRLSAHNIPPSLCNLLFVLNIKILACYNFGGTFASF